ncbi:hypothetical protein TPCV4_00970 [Cutibacterium avidum]|nr:hypothetical protein TPCV4_00970 [Cutibacterium avidum]
MTNFQKIYQRSYPVSPDGNAYVHNDLGTYTHNRPIPPTTSPSGRPTSSGPASPP